MSEDLIVECIYKECPFPVLSVTLEYCHVGYDDFNRMSCIPVSLDYIWKRYMFFSCFLVGILPCFRSNTSLFAAFVRKIVRKYPSGSLKYGFG